MHTAIAGFLCRMRQKAHEQSTRKRRDSNRFGKSKGYASVVCCPLPCVVFRASYEA